MGGGGRDPAEERRRRGPPPGPDRDLQPLRPRLRLLRPPGGQPRPRPVPDDAGGDPRLRPERPRFGYGTVVLQAGEDSGITAEWMADVVRRIKAETRLAVTLSLGERPDEDLAAWREAGADRYLLRFETSDPELYRAHPPPARPPSPIHRRSWNAAPLGYEVGSGSHDRHPRPDLREPRGDIALFRDLDLDMIGVGPYIPPPPDPPRPAGASAPGGGAGSQHRGDDLQGGRADAPRPARRQHPQHDGPGDGQPGQRPRAGPSARGQRGDAQPHPAGYRTLYEIYPDRPASTRRRDVARLLTGRVDP